jgi:putative phosphoesterase
MLIAVLSDTHSREANIAWAIEQCAGRGVEVIIHCGDIEDADAVRLFPAHTHFVFGNCDLDRAGISRAIGEVGAKLHESWGHLELAGKKLAWTHGDDHHTLKELENADAFDFVFYGHTHHAKEQRRGRTRVINPGALHRARPKGFIFLDLKTGKIERVNMAE